MLSVIHGKWCGSGQLVGYLLYLLVAVEIEIDERTAHVEGREVLALVDDEIDYTDTDNIEWC